MKRSCTILISHFESLNFLHTCISQIRKYEHPDIIHHIVIADQSRDLYHNGIVGRYWGDEDITVVKMAPLWSGFGIDYILRNYKIETEYVCQMHVDCVPIHKNWLYLPITLLEENFYHFVGQLHFWSRDTDTIYPPGPFFSMSPTFNVARTSTYKEMSLQAGFTRFHNRADCGLQFLNDDWHKWAWEDYQARGSDDDTVAFHWEDKYRQDDKLGLAITGFVQPKFGRIIEDIVFHFGSCREALGVMDTMPELYKHYTKKINEGYYNDELIGEMVSLAKANQPPQMEILRRNHWDGKLKISMPPPDELNKRIEELKNME